MKRLAYNFLLLACTGVTMISCGVQRKAAAPTATTFADSLAAILLGNNALQQAHVGISIYDPRAKRYVYNHQPDKYFIPASNTKIITCYAAMKHLGDSLVALRYRQSGDTFYVYPSGDPTLLHSDFATQPVVQWLSSLSAANTAVVDISTFREDAWGYGWSWDDYLYSYMAERSALPAYGNCLMVTGKPGQWSVMPEIKGAVQDVSSVTAGEDVVWREIGSNTFRIGVNSPAGIRTQVPFVTDSSKTAIALLQPFTAATLVAGYLPDRQQAGLPVHTLYSQPVDSLLKIMMHRSDNFFAEQTLLMVSDTMTGVMRDALVIDTLLQSDLAGLPHRPQWVDGSGLSRFNLFSPQDFVVVLDSMHRAFDWERITTIFPSGGKGTLSGRFTGLQGNIYAKTGTLSNNVALSGYLVTANNHTLIFSILVNNHMSKAATIRDLVEQYLSAWSSRY